MQKMDIDQKELYDLIKRAVRDVLQEEMFRHRLENLPFVSDAEMRDIEETHGTKPATRKNIGRIESIEV
jgi:translation elongation factor EF-Tu-like GTPase